MNPLIKPAVVFANRLQFSGKFVIIFVIFMLPLLIALWGIFNHSWDVIQKAESSREGQQLILALKPIAITMAKHRGNFSQHLNGTLNKVSAIQQLENTVQQLFSTYEEKRQSIDKFSTDTLDIDGIKLQWQSLLLSNATTNPGINFEAHSEVIKQVLNLIHQVANQSELILESNLSLYHLSSMVSFSIPELQEILGQLRGKAAGAIANAAISDKERLNIHTLLAMEENIRSRFQTNLKAATNLEIISMSLSTPSNRFDRELTTFINLIHSEVINTSHPTVSSDELFNIGTKTIDQLAKMNKQAALLITEIHENQVSKVRTQLDALIALVLAALALSIYLLLGITSSMRCSIQAIKNTSEQLSKGNFNTKYKIKTRDALSQITSSLNQMIKTVNGLISNIQSSTNNVETVSVQLSSSSTIIQDAVQQQHNQTALVATAATEMATTVKEIANNCSAAAQATQHAQTATTSGKSVINEAITSINNLAGDVDCVSETITALEQEVEQIGSVIDVIKSIAEQTNLLALNAAIEAARAGEQGRGFAVVADEVRSLAGRTQQSTTEIQTMIEKLQHGSKQAVQATETGKSRADNVVTTVDKAGDALSNIHAQIIQLVDINMQIATACKQQSTVAEEISENAVNMDTAAESILAQVKDTATSSDQLHNHSKSLTLAVKKFSIG